MRPINPNNHGEAASRRLLTFSGMFAAITALCTAYLFHLPTGSNGGYIHFGDTFIYLAACFLPLPYACLAASVGGGLADLLSGAPIWILPTMIIKPLTILCFTAKAPLLLNRRNIAALLPAGAISIAGYFLAETVFTGNWLASLALIWGNLIQAAGSGICFLFLAGALDRLRAKRQLGLDPAGESQNTFKKEGQA